MTTGREPAAEPQGGTGSAVTVRDVSHSFGSRKSTRLEVLDDLNLDVPGGAFVSLVGPSGCGKSTLLKVLAGLLRPSNGEATIGGVDAVGRTGVAAFMPQKDLLLPWRRAIDNAVLGAEIAGVDAAVAKRKALDMFPAFGLDTFEKAWPSQLSGGMRQRLALLRTFLHPGTVLLLDEPLGALDAITRREMHFWLQDVWNSDRRTIVLVTHDVEEALVLSDTVYVMSRRPGRFVLKVDVPFDRPRRSKLVSELPFVELKAKLLQALAGKPAE